MRKTPVPAPETSSSEPVTVRTVMRPGDLGRIVAMHGTLYAQEHGFDTTFEAYVAGPLAQFVLTHTDRERLWIAEQGARIVGCIAIVAAPAAGEAQLRWFLVEPAARGRGLGGELLREAVAFCGACGYSAVHLWTASALASAARLYRSLGFELVEERPGTPWGVEVVEQRYVLQISR